MSRKDDVALWLNDPVTQQFIALVQLEIRESRESAIEAACAGENATAPAATCKALRSVLTDCFDALMNGQEVKEAIKNADNEENPEELHPSRFANAVPQDDGDDSVDADPHT